MLVRGDNPDVLLSMGEQTMVHPYSEILLSNKKQRTIDKLDMDKSQINCTEQKKSDSKCYIPFDFIYITFWKM